MHNKSAVAMAHECMKQIVCDLRAANSAMAVVCGVGCTRANTLLACVTCAIYWIIDIDSRAESTFAVVAHTSEIACCQAPSSAVSSQKMGVIFILNDFGMTIWEATVPMLQYYMTR